MRQQNVPKWLKSEIKKIFKNADLREVIINVEWSD